MILHFLLEEFFFRWKNLGKKSLTNHYGDQCCVWFRHFVPLGHRFMTGAFMGSVFVVAGSAQRLTSKIPACVEELARTWKRSYDHCPPRRRRPSTFRIRIWTICGVSACCKCTLTQDALEKHPKNISSFLLWRTSHGSQQNGSSVPHRQIRPPTQCQASSVETRRHDRSKSHSQSEKKDLRPHSTWGSVNYFLTTTNGIFFVLAVEYGWFSRSIDWLIVGLIDCFSIESSIDWSIDWSFVVDLHCRRAYWRRLLLFSLRFTWKWKSWFRKASIWSGRRRPAGSSTKRTWKRAANGASHTRPPSPFTVCSSCGNVWRKVRAFKWSFGIWIAHLNDRFNYSCTGTVLLDLEGSDIGSITMAVVDNMVNTRETAADIRGLPRSFSSTTKGDV